MNILAFSIITRPKHLLIETDGIEEKEKSTVNTWYGREACLWVLSGVRKHLKIASLGARKRKRLLALREKKNARKIPGSRKDVAFRAQMEIIKPFLDETFAS